MVLGTTHLISPLPFLRVVFLLLGSALAVGLGLLNATVVILLRQRLDGLAFVLCAVAAVAVPLVVVALVAPLRQVEGVAAASLLGVRFAEGPPGPARTGEERLRATAWFLLHVLAGGALVVDLAVVLPFALARLFAPAGVVLLVAGTVGPVLLGAALARVAPLLLGPSRVQRLLQLEAEAARLVERERIARELHDSVGHALSVVALQAGAGRRRLSHDDVEFTSEALEAIETTARSATAELDHVLGLLREDLSNVGQGRHPGLGLEALPSLLAATAGAGLTVDADTSGELGDIPRVVSREAYRIVQESLTNALRHGSGSAASLHVERRPDRLEIRVTNPARARAAGSPGRSGRRGHGMVGLAERVHALGGTVSNGVVGDTWQLRVELPLPRAR